MLSKIVKLIVYMTLIIVTATLIYTSVMTIFFHVEYEKNFVFGCFLYYGIFALVLYGQKNKHLYLNTTLLNMLLIFNFCASILGALFDFYYKFPLWDNILHAIAGVILTVAMLNILFSLSKINLMQQYPKIVIFLFIVGCAISIGVFWEFLEFFIDTFLGHNMQKTFYVDSATDFYQYVDATQRFIAPSLVDTMYDLLEETITAILCGLFLILYGPINFYNKFLSKKNHVE